MVESFGLCRPYGVNEASTSSGDWWNWNWKGDMAFPKDEKMPSWIITKNMNIISHSSNNNLTQWLKTKQNSQSHSHSTSLLREFLFACDDYFQLTFRIFFEHYNFKGKGSQHFISWLVFFLEEFPHILNMYWLSRNVLLRSMFADQKSLGWGNVLRKILISFHISVLLSV